MNNLLLPEVLQNWIDNFKVNLSQGLFVFLLGILVVFFGIALIVLVVSVIGKIMSVKDEKAKAKKEIQETQSEIVEEVYEDIPDHVKAAIVAAITAYYFNQRSNCEFKVKKIKRI